MWLEDFSKAKNEGNKDQMKLLRKEIFFETAKRVEESGFVNPESTFYSTEISKIKVKNVYITTVTVVNEDCLFCASHIPTEEMPYTAVLNMADLSRCGGGVLDGHGAQEEYLLRCSNYFKSLFQFQEEKAKKFNIEPSEHQYPMDENFGAVFTKNVTVLRDTEETGYKFLDSPYTINMIAVAAKRTPLLIENRIAPEEIPQIKNKIRTILRVSFINNQRNLILGAFGCGVFKNPPQHTAELFKEVLGEPEFAGAFNKIVFAIKEDANSPKGGNFKPFSEVFKEKF